MTTKLHKAYLLNETYYYYYKCECENIFISNGSNMPRHCGCLRNNQRLKDFQPIHLQRAEQYKELLKQQEKEKQEAINIRVNATTKRCTECSEVKPITRFYRDKRRVDGREGRCKDCVLIKTRKRKGQQPQVYKTEEEKRIQRSLNKQARRTRERNAGPLPKAKDILELKEKQKNRCYWCSVDISEKFYKDHYIPVCKGGDSSIHNFVMTCFKCNASKNGRDPIEFANKIGRLF